MRCLIATKMNKGKSLRARKYRSPLRAAVHEVVKDLHGAGVMDKRTMRRSTCCVLLPFARSVRSKFAICAAGKKLARPSLRAI
jgi:hypothetical protein